MTLVETPEMADWLRTGRKGIAELLISHRIKSVCKLAAIMKENGQDGAPIYKEVVKMCEERHGGREIRKHAQGTHDQKTHAPDGGQAGKWRGEPLKEVLNTIGNRWRSKRGNKVWFLGGTTVESGWVTAEGLHLLGTDGVSRKFVSWKTFSRNYEPYG